MVWGCITPNGVGPLVRLEGKVNSAKYLQVIQDTIAPAFNTFKEQEPQAIFQQDNAPIHKGKKAMAGMVEAGIPLLPWPAYSPDLNPLENILERKIRAHYPLPKNQDELWALLQEEWRKISVEECRDLIGSLPKRLQECIRKHEWSTKY